MPIADFECEECGHRKPVYLPQPEVIELICDCSREKDIDDEWVVGTARYKRVWTPVALGRGSSGEPAR